MEMETEEDVAIEGNADTSSTATAKMAVREQSTTSTDTKMAATGNDELQTGTNSSRSPMWDCSPY